MIILQIEGATRTLGKSQGYLGLPVRDEVQEALIGNEVHRVQMMVTAWEPTPDELARLNAGAPVLLHVMGTAHPPVRLEVGDARGASFDYREVLKLYLQMLIDAEGSTFLEYYNDGAVRGAPTRISRPIIEELRRIEEEVLREAKS